MSQIEEAYQPTSSNPASPSQVCLCCGYSLAALPAGHACPECGFEYDPEAITLPVGLKISSRRKRIILALAGLTVFLFGLSLWRPGVKSMFDLTCLGLMVVCIGQWSRVLWTLGDQGFALVAGRNGLYCIRQGRFVCHPWSAIGFVKRDRFTGALIIYGSRGKKLLRVPVREFKSIGDVDTCVAEIDRARAACADSDSMNAT